MITIRTWRTFTVVDLINDRIPPVVNTDLDTEYHWEVADIHKETLGIEDENLIVDHDELPESGKVEGQIVRVDGRIYRWESE
jgi:hypothetical protein